MGKVNALEVLKGCFGKIVPEKNVRTGISSFRGCGVFYFLLFG